MYDTWRVNVAELPAAGRAANGRYVPMRYCHRAPRVRDFDARTGLVDGKHTEVMLHFRPSLKQLRICLRVLFCEQKVFVKKES